MLAGLAAASIPIILHLLNRRKFRERRWAAMRFLLAAIKKNQRRIRLEQWLLLAIRTLLIILVVSAMARPFLEQFRPMLPGQRSHRVIVLDGSMSMGYTVAEVSRFEQAKSLAQRLVKESRQGNAFSVVLMGSPPRILIPGPSANHDEVAQEIGEVSLTHGVVDLTATFETVDRVLAASDIRQKEVLFLTDLQAASWRMSRSNEDGLKRAVARLNDRGVRSSVIDLGGTGGENRAVMDLALNTPIVSLGGSSPIVTATLKNFGREPADGVRARLIVDGQITDDQSVALDSGEERTVSFVASFLTAGDHLVEVMIDDDPLNIDNHRWLAVPVRDRLRASLIDGDRQSEPFESETDYLAQALDPAEDTGSTPSAIKCQVAAESQLQALDLATFDVVLLCNVAQFTTEEARLLDAYLKQGGGVVLFGGDRVVAENYNRLLYQSGRGLLPAEIGPSMGSAVVSAQSSFRFDPLDFNHPVIRDYKGAAENVLAGFTGVRTWQYHKLKLPADTTAQVAFRFETGDPAVLERPRERGVVFFVATSADAGWGDWPLHPSFPPIMEQLVVRAAAGRLAERNVKVGQPLDQALPSSGSGAAATVTTPAASTVPAKLTLDGDVSRFRFEDTDLSGSYRVQVGPPLVVESLFAANTDPAESQLDKLDKSALALAVPGWDFNYYDDWRGLMQAPTSISQQGELHRPLLMGVLALLFIETVLAWIFGHHR
jgi:hypothetical protein